MSWSEIFLLLFVTIGPVRPSIAFYAATISAEPGLRRALAFRAVGIAALVTIIVTLVGSGILTNWRVRLEALEIAAGAILFISALQIVLGEEKQKAPDGPPPAPSLDHAIYPLAVPTILTPQGIAAVIAIETVLEGRNDFAILVALILGVMALNAVFLLTAHWIYARVKPAAIQVVVRVLGVLLAALAVQFAIFGFDGLGLIPNPGIDSI